MDLSKVRMRDGGGCYGPTTHGRATWLIVSPSTKTHYGVCDECVKGFSGWETIPLFVSDTDDSEADLWD